MELLPTLQTCYGMLWGTNAAEPQRRALPCGNFPGKPTAKCERDLRATIEALEKVSLSAREEGRFLVPRHSGSAPQLLVKAYNIGKTLPAAAQEIPLTRGPLTPSSKIACNLLELAKPIDLDFLKTIILNRHRLDIEQAVAMVIRLLPEFAAELVSLVPTIMTQGCMWLDRPIPTPQDTERCRRRFIQTLLSWTKACDYVKEEDLEWDELAPILFRIRRRDSYNASRCLRLPDWLHVYYPGDRKDLSWEKWDYPISVIDDPIVISRKKFNKLTRRLWRIVPNTPEKVLRRKIGSLSRKLVFAEDVLSAVKNTEDRKALAYTFIAIQRRLQLRIVSDLHGKFLGKGEMSKFQQNTPYIPTNFEERLGEIAVAGEGVDWSVLTAVQRPRGVEGVDDLDQLLPLVDHICECFEEYVVIYGKGHTETLRPQRGRRGGFRGPVDDWNAAVDVLAEIHRRINDAGYQVVSEESKTEEDGFEIVSEFNGVSTEKAMDLPRVDKFLALDIMSWNNSWGDDVFALEKMPPQWWTWLGKRREQGKCPLPATNIVID